MTSGAPAFASVLCLDARASNTALVARALARAFSIRCRDAQEELAADADDLSLLADAPLRNGFGTLIVSAVALVVALSIHWLGARRAPDWREPAGFGGRGRSRGRYRGTPRAGQSDRRVADRADTAEIRLDDVVVIQIQGGRRRDGGRGGRRAQNALSGVERHICMLSDPTSPSACL